MKKSVTANMRPWQIYPFAYVSCVFVFEQCILNLLARCTTYAASILAIATQLMIFNAHPTVDNMQLREATR